VHSRVFSGITPRDLATRSFDFLKPYCEVVYLSRTANISSTSIKSSLRIYSPEQLEPDDSNTADAG